MDQKFRSDCPITSALDIVGDKWVLVIIKQMLLEGSEKFKDFIASDEAIATNILSSKLKYLEELGLITKNKLEHDKKTNIYKLTEKALMLTPIIIELALWSDKNLRDLNPIIQNGEGLKLMKEDKEKFTFFLQDQYRKNNLY